MVVSVFLLGLGLLLTLSLMAAILFVYVFIVLFLFQFTFQPLWLGPHAVRKVARLRILLALSRCVVFAVLDVAGHAAERLALELALPVRVLDQLELIRVVIQ